MSILGQNQSCVEEAIGTETWKILGCNLNECVWRHYRENFSPEIPKLHPVDIGNYLWDDSEYVCATRPDMTPDWKDKLIAVLSAPNYEKYRGQITLVVFPHDTWRCDDSWMESVDVDGYDYVMYISHCRFRIARAEKKRWNLKDLYDNTSDMVIQAKRWTIEDIRKYQSR